METEYLSATQEELFTQLFTLIETLRSDGGCPWDKRQTPQSLIKYLKEECGELMIALEQQDTANICEELGDVFFILAMLITMHQECGQFTAATVLQGINDKMIRRHPHVFGQSTASTEQELKAQWDRIKASEKQNPSA